MGADLSALRALVEAVTDRNATWDQCRICAFTASSGLVRHDPNCPVPAALAALARLEEPTPTDLIRELRETLGLWNGARPESPQTVWQETLRAIAQLRSEFDATADAYKRLSARLEGLTEEAVAKVMYDAHSVAREPHIDTEWRESSPEVHALYLTMARAALALLRGADGA